MNAINIKAYTDDVTQIEAIKAMMKAFKIKFEILNEKNYNPKFVEKIEKSLIEIENGEVTRVKKEDLKQFLGL
jgi:hypothetical protein